MWKRVRIIMSKQEERPMTTAKLYFEDIQKALKTFMFSQMKSCPTHS